MPTIAALIVLALSGLSDWADGVLARRLNQTSRIGALLDPRADRLYILATLVGLCIRHIIPWWLAVVIVGRDLVLAPTSRCCADAVWTRCPVHYLGKAATFCLLYAFPLLLLADRTGTCGRHRRALSRGRSRSGAPGCICGRVRSTDPVPADHPARPHMSSRWQPPRDGQRHGTRPRRVPTQLLVDLVIEHARSRLRGRGARRGGSQPTLVRPPTGRGRLRCSSGSSSPSLTCTPTGVRPRRRRCTMRSSSGCGPRRRAGQRSTTTAERLGDQVNEQRDAALSGSSADCAPSWTATSCSPDRPRPRGPGLEVRLAEPTARRARPHGPAGPAPTDRRRAYPHRP